MNNKDELIQSALAMFFALGITITTSTASAADNSSSQAMEKCYGISKAHKNDCQTSKHSCAGSATSDRQPDAFVLLPKGICNKVSGGTLSPEGK